MKFLKYHVWFWLWLIIIFIESGIPSTSYPEIDIWNFDKVVHICIYGLLAFLCYLSLIHQKQIKFLNESPLIFTVIICSIYGASDEIHQLFVVGRTCDFFDWVADTSGAIIAALIIKYYLQLHFKTFMKLKV